MNIRPRDLLSMIRNANETDMGEIAQIVMGMGWGQNGSLFVTRRSNGWNPRAGSTWTLHANSRPVLRFAAYGEKVWGIEKFSPEEGERLFRSRRDRNRFWEATSAALSKKVEALASIFETVEEIEAAWRGQGTLRYHDGQRGGYWIQETLDSRVSCGAGRMLARVTPAAPVATRAHTAPMIAAKSVRNARRLVCDGQKAARFAKRQAHRRDRRAARAALRKGDFVTPCHAIARATGRDVA